MFYIIVRKYQINVPWLFSLNFNMKDKKLTIHQNRIIWSFSWHISSIHPKWGVGILYAAETFCKATTWSWRNDISRWCEGRPNIGFFSWLWEIGWFDGFEIQELNQFEILPIEEWVKCVSLYDKVMYGSDDKMIVTARKTKSNTIYILLTSLTSRHEINRREDSTNGVEILLANESHTRQDLKRMRDSIESRFNRCN